jgi:hypothetical protein
LFEYNDPSEPVSLPGNPPRESNSPLDSHPAGGSILGALMAIRQTHR